MGDEGFDVLFGIVLDGEHGLDFEETGGFLFLEAGGGFCGLVHGFLFEESERVFDVDREVGGVAVHEIGKPGSVPGEKVREKLLLALEKGIVVGVRENHGKVVAGLLVDEALDQGVRARRIVHPPEGSLDFKDGLDVEIVELAEMVGDHLAGVHHQSQDGRIGELAHGAGFFSELDAGDGMVGVDVPEVGAGAVVDDDLVLVLVDDVEAFVVDDDGVATVGLDPAVGDFPAHFHDVGLDVLVVREGDEFVGGNAREVDAVVEAGDDAGFGRVYAEPVAEGGEGFGVGRPEEADEFDVVAVAGGFGRYGGSEMDEGHHVGLRVEDVQDLEFVPGDESEILDSERPERKVERVGIGNDSVEGAYVLLVGFEFVHGGGIGTLA